MGLKDIGSALPPGFRFYPSDEELVCHYLYKKIVHHKSLTNTLIDIDLHICEPWQLPDVAKLNSDEWYFFSFRGRKYATGFRISRATASGYWKATGKDRTIRHPKTKAIVGMRKTLVFYQSRAPHGIKTSWIMHEFRLENPHLPPKEDWVLCRVFQKSKSKTDGELSPKTYLYDNNIAAVPTSPTLGTSPPFDYSLFAGNYDNIDDNHHLSPLTFPDTPPQTSPNNNNNNNNDNKNSDIFNTFNNFPTTTTTDEPCSTNFMFDINYGHLQQGTVALSDLTNMQFDSDDGGLYDYQING